MNKEYKGFKEGNRYLVKDDSKFWDTSLVEIYVLEISEKAIKIKYENGYTKWYFKESFDFSIIENLSEVKVVKQIIEENSKLEWEQNPPSNPMTWYEAMKYAESLNTMSDYEWRLPTVEELEEAYDSEIEGFQSGSYWSSSTYAQDTNNAWFVDFGNGFVGYNDKSFNYYVRCVRDVKNPKQTIEDRSHEISFDDEQKNGWKKVLL